jgi:hypothetical protein
MHGLPEDTDLTFFRGAALQQACVGQNEVILRLDPDIEVMVAGDIRMTSAAGVAQLSQTAPRSGCLLVSLLGRVVEAAHPEADGSMKLTWNSGEIVEVLDSFPEFESYTVRSGERVIVV